MSSFNNQLIEELRANGGKAGGMFADRDLIILTTTGAQSGLPREAPLVYVMDGSRFIIVASNGGQDVHPSWYYNLLAHPRARAEVEFDAFEVDATVLEGEDRERAFDAVVARYPGFADYRDGTSRVLPVLALTRVD
jgi:deazaflavin-dependent oxidoreductase (nitroreductase family)